MKYKYLLTLLVASALSAEPQSVMFDPPTGWKMADAKQLPRYVEAMVVGESRTNYPPSINVGVEDFTGSLKDYLKIVKKINEAQHSSWKSLGTIETQAGQADLSIVDIQTSWGPVRLVHVILVKEGKAIILTGATKREEFTTLYPVLLKSMRSLRLEMQPALPIIALNDQPRTAPVFPNPAGSSHGAVNPNPSGID